MVPLDVSITEFPENGGSTEYPAGSLMFLLCANTGSFADPLQYSWTSTCTGKCFVPGNDQSLVIRTALRGADNGVHTCTVTDYAGRQGTASVTVNIVGKFCVFAHCYATHCTVV